MTASTNLSYVLDLDEPWAVAASETILGQTEAAQIAWSALLEHCRSNKSAKPSKRWLKIAAQHLDVLTPRAAHADIAGWLPHLKSSRTKPAEVDEYSTWAWTGTELMLSEPSVLTLKGLLWLLGQSDQPICASALRKTAEMMFKKVPGIGMRNAKVGNAALLALSNMEGDLGVKEIGILHAQTKYNPALTNIKRVFSRIADERGITVDELAASTVSDYGLDADGVYEETLGDFVAQVTLISPGKAALVWRNSTGKEQKSVPSAIKDPHKDEIKALKALVTDLQKASSAQSQRLENDYLSEPEHNDPKQWFARYIEHPVTGAVGRRLVWRFILQDDTAVDGLWTDGQFVDLDAEPIEWAASRAVKLWHPIDDSAENIGRWRAMCLAREVTQPFKQVFREVYILTDAERQSGDESARFAGHIVKQAQFNALATGRFWKQTRGGPWDGGHETDAHRTLAHHGITVLYATSPIEELGTTPYGMHEHLSTGTVRFYRQGPLQLTNLDPLVFSEIMRDVDLFVAVSSVSNDPDWQHRQHHTYWQDNSFGDLNQTAQTRRVVLESMVPKLKIAKQLSLSDRFLTVAGTLRTYHIHLGSGNILMDPNDQYLCIVSGAVRSKAVYLPFEGDARLTLILSKAFLLADDHKIKDATIMSQIQHAAAA